MAINIRLATALLAATVFTCWAQRVSIPHIADVSHASPEAVKFFYGLLEAKSEHNGTRYLEYLNPIETSYYDSTLGATEAANRSQAEQIFAGTLPAVGPDAIAYPLRILGDIAGGAVMYFVDTPGFFGTEIRSMSAYDFVNGTIVRQVDYWDGRGNSATKSLAPNPPQPYPSDLGLAGIKESAAPELVETTYRLNAGFSSGNATAVAALLSYDAIFEDLPLRLRVEGRIAITSYLQRAVSSLPYGPDTTVSHVLGSIQGGGYEWKTKHGSAVRNGIAALELDCEGKITRFTATWDGNRLSKSTIRGLAKLAPTPDRA